MKIRIYESILMLLLLTSFSWTQAQITTPVIRGLFGVDADVQSDFFENDELIGSDDWYYPFGSTASSVFVIDTNGAGAKLARYAAGFDKKIPFYKKMRYPAFSLVGSRTLIDAIFVRDYHDKDSTAFALGSNKNGQSPADWSVPDYQSVPDKNDILDAYVHIRREGPTSSINDTLWMFGGLALENTNGQRYFDFELYQTDIFYTRGTHSFTGYGPDAGHTSWKFDAAGNVTQVGDIIFSAEYGSSDLSAIEARIWIDYASLSITPKAFNWKYTFDGAGPTYGYAGIKPKTADPFYFGSTNPVSTWAGPFGIVRANDAVLTSFQTGQFMEFGVNMTVLGLNPDKLLGTTTCGIPFSKILIKTRSSVSFTAELKDFIGPFDLFLPDKASAVADVPVFCGVAGISQLEVVNPYETSSYVWTTTNGHISGSNTGTTITVDQPGTYIVTQKLETSCPDYAADTIVVSLDPSCVILADNRVNFNGALKSSIVHLNWSVTQNQDIKLYTIERSTDGIHFTLVDTINNQSLTSQYFTYQSNDNVSKLRDSYVYYRIKMSAYNGQVQYSKVIKVSLTADHADISLQPNPVHDQLQINIFSSADRDVQVYLYTVTGQLVKTLNSRVKKGYATVTLNDFQSWTKGVYTVKVVAGSDVFVNKVVLVK
jgi:hypothetical protein